MKKLPNKRFPNKKRRNVFHWDWHIAFCLTEQLFKCISPFSKWTARKDENIYNFEQIAEFQMGNQAPIIMQRSHLTWVASVEFPCAILYGLPTTTGPKAWTQRDGAIMYYGPTTIPKQFWSTPKFLMLRILRNRPQGAGIQPTCPNNESGNERWWSHIPLNILGTPDSGDVKGSMLIANRKAFIKKNYSHSLVVHRHIRRGLKDRTCRVMWAALCRTRRAPNIASINSWRDMFFCPCFFTPRSFLTRSCKTPKMGRY